MIMWKLELEDEFFRIYDSKKQIAGYFDPDYGDIFPKEKQSEIIEQMHKNHDKILGGFVTFPLVKFGIFDSDKEMDISYIASQLESAIARLKVWDEFLLKNNFNFHAIRVSHTDQDMLSITIQIKFNFPVPLEKKSLTTQLEPILNLLQIQHLL